MSEKGKIRIIGGKWRRTPLTVLDSDGLRPTGDRQRETLFNWLDHLLGGFDGKRALDLFAGTGALSFEWISRGGELSVLFEKNRKTAGAIKTTIEKLGASESMVLIMGDSFSGARALEGKIFDVVFIDPPFALGLQLKAMKFALRHLAPEGLIYTESPAEITDGALVELKLEAVKRLKAGNSHLLLAKKVQDFI